MTRQKRLLGTLRRGTKELGTVWRRLLDSALLLITIFLSALGSSRLSLTHLSNGSSGRSPTSPAMVHPVVPLLPPSNGSSNVMAKKAIISTHGAQNSILFGEDGEGSLALLISLERSQHF